jgi:hypothetical protein
MGSVQGSGLKAELNFGQILLKNWMEPNFSSTTVNEV